MTLFEQIVSLENLFAAWDAFQKDKRMKPDVQVFAWQLEPNLFQLHRDLRTQRYRHGAYTSFFINDPKRRHIHKATVRDRIVHHAVFRVLNPVFEPTFIPNSFSCRFEKGTHKGVETLHALLRTVSRNDTRPCFALKCDIQKFFASVDHDILLSLIRKKIKDAKALWIVEEIIRSYPALGTERERERERERE